MRNLIVLAMLVVATASYTQEKTCPKSCFDTPKNCLRQGHEMTKQQMHCAYNAPANIQVRGSWDLYATASYLFWQAREENLELGLSTSTTAPDAISSYSTVKYPKFAYRSGFKVGLGLQTDYDNWDAFAEYTWYHTGSVNTKFNPASGSFIYPIQGAIQEPADFTSATQSWNLKMDLVDLSLARAYYSGTKLTVRPFFGARGAWIRQTLNTNYFDSSVNSDNTYMHSSSVSQAVGPRMGFESNWLTGYGFRLIGNASGDILYTRYDVKFDQTGPSTTASQIQTKIDASHADYLRTHAALDMGFGWGSYFNNNNWHIDFLAIYGFQVFWDQNMIRFFSQAAPIGGESSPNFGKSFAPNGNLYIHGLTFNVKVDF